MKYDKHSEVIKFILNEIKTGNRGEIPQDIYYKYFRFRYNFFKYIGVSELSNLYDYKKQVMDYIEQLYPFCFMALDELSYFPEVLNKYIYLLGGNKKDIEEIYEILKKVPIKNIDRNYYITNYDHSWPEESVNLANTLGTSVEEYQESNLYDVLMKIDDKYIDNYMWYLCINNVFNNKEKFEAVFSDLVLIVDENNILYVAEGNHRVFSYLALLKIREHLGLENRSMNFELKKKVLKYNIKTQEISAFSM